MTYICDDCGREFDRNSDGWITDANGRRICQNCAENYSMCTECNEYFRTEDMERDSYGNLMCVDCYNEQDDNDYGISCYHHHHGYEPTFFGDTKGNSLPYLGVEIEVDKGGQDDSTAEAVKNIMGHDFLYCESDGSISNGFENITQPATLEYHTSMMDRYCEAFKMLVSKGYRSHNTKTCGFHVHFNRDFFGDNDACIARLLYVTEKFWDELSKFSRRSIDNIEQWAKKYKKKPEEILEDMSVVYDHDRYHAINLTNENTIEFRIFRGTLNPNTFLATLQLVNNIVTFCKNVQDDKDLQSVEWEDFINTEELKEYWEIVKDRVVS